MPNYDYLCSKCDTAFEAVIEYSKRDAPQTCPGCGGQAKRAWLTAPQVRTAKTSRTFIDGTKREGFEDLKQIAKLQQAKAESVSNDEKAAMSKEINERRKIKK